MNEEENKDDVRKNVLDSKTNGEPPRHFRKIAWLSFLLALVLAIMSDLSVILLKIPNFNELNFHEGIIEFTEGGRRNSYLSLSVNDETIIFQCWITASSVSNCIKKEQRDFYMGKKATIYSYRALIDGVFHENRLLQLEIDGKEVINYNDKKIEYLWRKDKHLYFQSYVFCLTALGIVFVYLILKSNLRNKDDES